MHTLYSKTRVPHNTFCRFGFAAYRHGGRWFYAAVSFSIEKLVVKQLYTDVQLLNRLLNLTGKAARMPLFKNVRPCTFLNYEFFYRKTRFCLETLTSCQQQRRLRRSRNSPSIRTRMSVVPHRSDVFCLSKKLDAQQNIRMYFVG